MLPAGDYGSQAPSYEADDEWRALYPTLAGAVGLHYTPQRRPRHEDSAPAVPGTGTLALALFDTTHEVLEARTFQMAYREARIR